MTAVANCIRSAAEAGVISEQKAREVANILDEAERQRLTAGDPTSVADVAPSVLKALTVRAQKRRKNVARQTAVQMDMERVIGDAPGRAPQAGILQRLGQAARVTDDALTRGEAIIAPNFWNGFSALNLQRAIDVHAGRMQAAMTGFLDRFRSRAAGFVREKAGLRDVVRELYGEDTGNASAKELAGGVRAALDYELAEKRRLGADVARIENYVPQRHDPKQVRAAGEREWIGFIAPRLDRRAMIDDRTGLPLTDEQLDEMLRGIFHDITTANAQKIKPDGFVQTTLLKRMERERRLHFKDADAWLTYQERFGDGDLWNLVTGHIQSAARDLGTLQVFGPMPSASLRFLEKLVEKRLREADPEARVGNRLRNLYDTVTGAVNTTHGGSSDKWAKGFETNRAILLSGLLGGAFLSSLTDVGFGRMAARMVGLPYGRVLRQQLRLLNPANNADRRQAVRLGFTAHGWISRATAAQRLVGDVVGHEWSRRVLDTTLRLSLLSPWTDAGRWAFGTEMLGFITEQVGRTFDDLPDPLRTTFQRHGIGADDWDTIRATELFTDPETGATFLRAEDVVRRGGAAERAGDLLQAMIMTEVDAAVPQATAVTRTAFLGGTRPATFVGEVMRHATLLKSFPVTIMHIQSQRTAAQQGGLAKGKYLAHLLAGTMAMGMLAEQLSRVSRGQEPGDMDDPGLWLDVAWRSGTFGLIGDFLFADMGQQGGIANALMGPIAQELQAGYALTFGNVHAALEGRRLNFGRDLRRFVSLMLPGNRLWYARLAIERLFHDEMQKLTDPRAAESFNARVRAAERRGEGFFAPPGQGLGGIEFVD